MTRAVKPTEETRYLKCPCGRCYEIKAWYRGRGQLVQVVTRLSEPDTDRHEDSRDREIVEEYL